VEYYIHKIYKQNITKNENIIWQIVYNSLCDGIKIMQLYKNCEFWMYNFKSKKFKSLVLLRDEIKMTCNF